MNNRIKRGSVFGEQVGEIKYSDVMPYACLSHDDRFAHADACAGL